jgi:A/G-specific adenine glycosylase
MILMNRSRRARINFASRVIKWGRQSAKRYPWRNTSDPYAILIAELMLRKTTRRQVEKVFVKFLRRFPDPCSLSRARVRDIKYEIRSLGLESVRARGLSKIAKVLMTKYEGRVPDDRESLLDLPHVGPYIANAVLCMAHDQQLPLVDTNTIRVVSRAFSIQSERKRDRTDPKMWTFVASLLPHRKARQFNLAMLDLAPSLCLPNNPKCTECPVLGLCDYGRRSVQSMS